MSGGLLELLPVFAGVVLTGAAIKLLDDVLDAEYDICRGEQTLAVKLGRSALPYAMVLLLFGSYIHLPVAVALFLSSYAVGMLSNWREKLPSRLPAYAEMVAAAGLSFWLAGWRIALWALALTALFDWLDDLVDMAGDRASGQRNLALRLGVVETALLALLALCTAVLANPWWTAVGLIGFIVLLVLAELTTTCVWQASDSDGEVSS